MNEQLKVVISAEIGKFKQNVSNAKKEIEKFAKGGKESFKAFNEEFQKVGAGAKKALGVMSAAIVGAATALLALGASTQEYRNEQAKLITAFEAAGGSAKDAKATYNDLFRVLGDAGQATEAAAHIAKLTTNEKDLAEWTTICQGVYAEFGASLPIESLTEAANETAKVGTTTGALADALNWAGVSEDAFNEKLAACNTEAERERLIRETLNGLYSESAAIYEKNNAAVLAQNEANLKMQNSMAKIGEAVAPINTALTSLGADVLAQLEPYITQFAQDYLPQITEALSNAGTAIGKVITFIADNWGLISTLAITIAAICATLSVFATVMGIVNAVMMASPITWIVMGIVAAIAALVAIVVVCILHWDKIKAATVNTFNKMKEIVANAINAIVGFFQKIINFVKNNWQGLLLLIVNPFAGAFKLAYDNCEGFRNKVNNIFNQIKSGISEKINAAKDAVGNAIQKIKNFFNFSWSLPKLKMPHISISGEFSLVPPKVPSFSIDWYAKGGVFDKPTLFGYGGSLGGLGEAGAEAVVPLERNLGWLDKLATMLNEKQGNKPIYLVVDKRIIGQVSADGINEITRATGIVPIKVM